MPMTVSNPRDLLLQGLSDVLFVERMLAFEVLPDLVRQVQLESLAECLERHLAETREHVERVECSFDLLGAEPSSSHSRPFVGLRDQHAERAGSMKHWALADLFHATAAAHVERYEIGVYSLLVELARACGREKLATLLDENRAGDAAALAELEQVAGKLAAEAASLEAVGA